MYRKCDHSDNKVISNWTAVCVIAVNKTKELVVISTGVEQSCRAENFVLIGRLVVIKF